MVSDWLSTHVIHHLKVPLNVPLTLHCVLHCSRNLWRVLGSSDYSLIIPPSAGHMAAASVLVLLGDPADSLSVLTLEAAAEMLTRQKGCGVDCLGFYPEGSITLWQRHKWLNHVGEIKTNKHLPNKPVSFSSCSNTMHVWGCNSTLLPLRCGLHPVVSFFSLGKGRAVIGGVSLFAGPPAWMWVLQGRVTLRLKLWALSDIL